VEPSTISIVESATIVESTPKAVTMETTITEAASHAAVEAAAFHGATPQAATCKAATVKTSTSEATTMATAKTATAHAAAKAATAAAMTAPAAATSAAARQRYGRRNQADARNCQQRDNRFAQHHHSPSEIRSLPQAHCRWRSFRKTAIDFDESVAQVFASDAKLTLKLENESSAKTWMPPVRRTISLNGTAYLMSAMMAACVYLRRRCPSYCSLSAKVSSLD
jgi:hypothetical protein